MKGEKVHPELQWGTRAHFKDSQAPHYTTKPRSRSSVRGFQKWNYVFNVKLFLLKYIIFISETHLHKVEFPLKRGKEFNQIYIKNNCIIKKLDLKGNTLHDKVHGWMVLMPLGSILAANAFSVADTGLSPANAWPSHWIRTFSQTLRWVYEPEPHSTDEDVRLRCTWGSSCRHPAGEPGSELFRLPDSGLVHVPQTLYQKTDKSSPNK